MKVDYNNITKVLALFDEEDIPYIKSDHLLEVQEIDFIFSNEDKAIVKVKKKGDENVRKRK